MDLFKTLSLLTGQSAPFTGTWQNSASSRDALYSAYTNGSGSVTLQYKNPFGFENELEGIPFYSFSGMTSGYSLPAYSTSPMNDVRAISAGSGQFWVATTIQN
jgi:hypothetical protein